MFNEYPHFKERTESTRNDMKFVPKKRLYEKVSRELVPGFPIGRTIPFDRGLMVKAIHYGMVIKVKYRGDKDDNRSGRDRTIYPMVLGINRNTRNLLLRAWHLEGYSVKEGAMTEKVWRLFKTSNIINMTFIGDFYRLPPIGYQMNDRIMTEITVARADFNVIRKNQNTLVEAGKIESEEKSKISDANYKITSIVVRETNTTLNLANPFENANVDRRNINTMKFSVLKSVYGDRHIVVLGAIGTPGRTVKLFMGRTLIGMYKTVKSFTGDQIGINRQINGVSEFDCYIFEKRLD